MPYLDDVHALQIALATALRERDEARALAKKWARLEGAAVNRGIRADADALSEIQGLQAKVERLRGDLVKYGSHVDGCSGGDFCSCGLEVARLQAARADAAEVAHDSCAAYAHELSEALAAARRECEGLRSLIIEATLKPPAVAPAAETCPEPPPGLIETLEKVHGMGCGNIATQRIPAPPSEPAAPAPDLRAVRSRITEYLSHGGLFNPELMDHRAVSLLLRDARAAIDAVLAARAAQHAKGEGK